MVNKKTKYLSLLLIVLAFSGLIYAYRTNVLESKDSITIAIIQQPTLALMYVAEKQGYFEAEDITVHYEKYLLGRDALKAAIEGKADLATVYDIPTLNQINNGVNLGILTTLHSSTQNHAIVAFKKSGITTPADLRGKKIAMTQGVSTEFFLYALLLAEGIELSEVTPVSLEPDQIIPALEEGSIAAGVLFNPFISALNTKYTPNDLVFFYTQAYTEMSVLTGKQEVINQNQEEITKVLKALYKAEKFIQNNQAESIQLVSEWLEYDDPKLVRLNWEIYSFSLTLSNRLLSLMERESIFFVNQGVYSENTPYLRRYFLPDLLASVKPQGVTVY
jgi:ABC-type nitrate/sulfonate/bicarbonate transport system substrate-binding protein